MNDRDSTDSKTRESDELSPIPLPDFDAAPNDDERVVAPEFGATGGAFWAEALRDAATPTMESAKFEELVETLGKDPGVQDKLDDEEEDLEFGD